MVVIVKKNNHAQSENNLATKIQDDEQKIGATTKNGIGSHMLEHETSHRNGVNSPSIENISASKKWNESLIERGKDLLSHEATSVATAGAIILGAALIEVELIPGLVIGAGAILLGKVFPEFGSYIRPAIKGAVRAGFNATNKARQIFAEANEQVSDLVAEVKQEQHDEIKQERGYTKAENTSNELPTH